MEEGRKKGRKEETELKLGTMKGKRKEENKRGKGKEDLEGKQNISV